MRVRFTSDEALSSALPGSEASRGAPPPPHVERIRGFPSPLDREIFALGVPALFTVLLEPLLGMTDVGALCAAPPPPAAPC